MQVLRTIADCKKARDHLHGTLGLVPTMGYLHEGHLSLVREARVENDILAVSIFVNPSQFGPDEDLATYPRDMDGDLALLRAEGTDLVFTPSAEDMYPRGFDSWIEVGDLGRRLEGEFRPDHFRGVATVVAKLFNILRPHRAYFGQKDGQQVVVIRQMVADLNVDIDIVVVPTMREADGLAMSSRNLYLTPDQRKVAPVIYGALYRAREAWERGEMDAERLRREVRSVLEQEPLVERIDYVSVADGSSLEELDVIDRPAMVSVTVHMGRTRLIDNVLLG